mmetsp:Transcript_12162/g.13867  ORF Transcript_12162/g.13867 Transcript_12162/m.13867 type:complete len:89 (-) Transcript_12162:196-462(-)
MYINGQYIRSRASNMPANFHASYQTPYANVNDGVSKNGTLQSTFNPGRYFSTPKRRYQLPTKGNLKYDNTGTYTTAHSYKLYPNRLVK